MSHSHSTASDHRPLALLHLSAASPPPQTSQPDSSPRMDSSSSFLSLSPSAAESAAASATLSPLAATKKRLRSIDASAGADAASVPHSALRTMTPGSASDSSPSPIRSAAIAGRRAASSSSLSSLAGAGLGSSAGMGSAKDNSDLQRLLDDSDDEEDEEADEVEEDGDDESEEKSPIASSHGGLTPLSSMAAAAAASQGNLSASPLAPAAQPSASPALLPMPASGSEGSGGGSSGGTEFLSQLFVVYMPKNNFKRFVVSSLNTMIIRASKTEKAMPRANHPPMSSRPAANSSTNPATTSRPPIPPLAASHASHWSSSAAAGGPTSPSAAKKPLPSASFSSSSSVSEQDSYTYNVAMEDVIACLQAHGVTYNPSFMWMDLSDFGQRFVQQMMDNSKASADGTPSPTADAQPANDTYGGLWYNVVHKSHLVVNYFSHPFLGEGYAVVITLDLLDANKDQSLLSQAAMAESQTQTVTISNDTLYKATRNINEGGITAHPAILTAASTAASPASLTTLTPFPLPSIALPAEPLRESGNRRKVRPVESIGEMLDRIADYQRIRLQVKSKNKACERLGYSKGTINAYREKVKQALSAGIDLSQVRQTKYRDFKRVLEAAQAAGGAGGGGGSPGGGAGGGAGKAEKAGSVGGLKGKKDDGLKRKSNSFGDLGMALMAKQDARNGGRKAKADVGGEGKRSDDDDSESEESAGDSSSGGLKQPSSGRQRKQRSPGKLQEVGVSAVPLLSNSTSVASSPPQATHHLQSLLSTTTYTTAQPHSQLTYLSPAPQHSTFTATPLPAGTTYVLSQPAGAPLAGQYGGSAFGQYGGPAQYGGGGAVYAGPGAGGQFQPGSVVRAANGATYQITGPMTQVQMANVQTVPAQQGAFTRFM